jgi:F0F1-type ATP synthase assembly protein I
VGSNRDNQEINRKSGIAYAAAFTLFACVTSLSGAGWLADRWFGTKPWLLVGGVVVGAIVGFYQFVRLTSQL